MKITLIGGVDGAGAPALLCGRLEPEPIFPTVRFGASSNLLDYSIVDVRGILCM